MGKVEHYKKRTERENINKLLKLMKDKGHLSFTEAKNIMGVSSVTLSSYLTQLQEEQKIERYVTFKPDKKGKSKRYRGYRPKIENLEKVNAQIGRFEALKFIETIPDPFYAYKPIHSKKGEIRGGVALFASIIDKPRKPTEALLMGGVNAAKFAFEKFKVMNMYPRGVKMAFVIMIDSEEGSVGQ